MRLLLDTQALIWHFEDNPALSNTAIEAIENRANQIFVSVVSLWEMSIKTGIGKLRLSVPVKEIVSRYKAEDVTVLPIFENHALGVASLPHIHRDPFDRLLVSQAQCEDLVILTVDACIHRYPVKHLW